MNPFTENKTALKKRKEKIKRQMCLVHTTKNYLLPSK